MSFEESFPAIVRSIERELKPPAIDENYWTQARIAKERIALALAGNNEAEGRSAIAAYGGLVKRWRRFLVETITDAIWGNQDCSREYIRDWQQRIFGRAIASRHLKAYAKTERSGGGRAVITEIAPHLEADATEFFKRYQDKIKDI